MRFLKLKFLFLLSGLLAVSCTVSINNIWKVSNTDLAIAVEKKAASTKNEFEREMILRENQLDKLKIKLAKGINDYSRINVHQIGEDQYLLEDAYESYILDTKPKTLTKTSRGVLTQTFEDTKFPKFVGAFDDNENGGWRFIPASERAEIPVTVAR